MSDGKPPRILYHYASQKGLLGILKKQALFGTKIRYLDDESELIGPLRIALNVLRQTEQDPKLGDKQREIVRATTWAIEQSRNINIPVASFTAEADSEYVWREYAAGGSGYAIGFDSDTLCPPAQQCVLLQCEYRDDDTQRETISGLIAAELGGPTSPGQWSLYSRLMTLAMTVKSKVFAKEDEWRLVPCSCFWPDLSNYTYWTCRFRSGKRGLIPYWLLPIDLCAITSIVIGPMLDQELAADGVRGLMHRFQLREDIQIAPSKVSPDAIE